MLLNWLLVVNETRAGATIDPCAAVTSCPSFGSDEFAPCARRGAATATAMREVLRKVRRRKPRVLLEKWKRAWR